ncbi:MAG TPA: hypothetical protein VHG28_19335 [Longimicrobiaceae bacterium]|nr:hypothetical protein [Longimicrobiaceae bacterium]
MRIRYLFTASVLALTACSDGVGPEPGALRIEASTQVVPEGGTLTLSATSAGRKVAPGSLAWESRDPSTLTVRDGVVRGVAPGVAYVVARGNGEADSVLITVRFAQVGPGTAAVRVAGAQGTVVRFGGTAVMLGTLDAPPTTTWFHAADVFPGASIEDTQKADSLLLIGIPGVPKVGSTTLKAPKVVTSPRFEVRPRMYLQIREGFQGQRYKFRIYVPVAESQLEITAVQLPPSPGLAVGLVVGSIAFEAAGFTVEIASDGSQTVLPIGNTTSRVYAEFLLPIHHKVWTGPRDVKFRLEGGHYPGEPEIGAHANYVPADVARGVGGVSVKFGYAQMGEGPNQVLIGAALWIPNPAPGTFPLDTGIAYRDSVAGDRAAMRVEASRLIASGGGFTWGERDHTPCVKGILRVTGYQAPTGRAYGRVVGELSCQGWPSSQSGGGAARITSTFKVPINPLGRLP